MTPIPFIAALALLAAAGVETALPPAAPAPVDIAETAPAHPEARPYDQAADAMAAIDSALARAAAADKRVVIVLGANWCHDSRGLAGWLETPRFAAMMAPKYEIVFVDAGHPQDGDPANPAVAARFGMKRQKGTPAVFIVDADGNRLNSLADAASWGNAASRDEDAIYTYFDRFE